MSTLFDRVYSLEVGNDAETLSIDGFGNDPAQIQFRVIQGATAYVTRAQISIYGLSRETRQRAYDRYKRIKLTAGFRERYGEIFRGEIYNSEILRDGPENVITFFARSSGVEWTGATVTKTFGAGTPMVEVIREAGETYGAPVEFVGDFSDLPKLISSLPVQMGTTKFLGMLSRQFDFTIQRQPNGLVLYRDDAERDRVHETNAITGMVGTPRIRERGIDVTTKLNTDIRLRDIMEITNLTGQLVYNNPDAVRFEDSIGTGRYTIMAFSHAGDLYGDQWDTVIEGLNPRAIRSGS